jgi:hypothetical protein
MTTISSKIPTIPGVCAVCGNDFLGCTRKKMYCSDSCRQVAYKTRHYLYAFQRPKRSEYENAISMNKELKVRNSNLAKERFYLIKERDQLRERVKTLQSQNETILNRVDQMLNYKQSLNLKDDH